MLIIKLKFKINKLIKLFIYKMCYRNHFKYKKINFRRRFYVLIENGGNVSIDKDCFFNNGCSINCIKSISIGENCIFGEDVKLYDHNHVFNKDGLIKNQGMKVEPIKIGNNVWICSNVIILPGTTIGDNVVIGAGIIVQGDIPSNSIVKRDSKSFYLEAIKTR